MSAARSPATSPDRAAAHGALHGALHGAGHPSRGPEKPAAPRLADDLAVPTPSPVHHLQAGLAQLTTPEAAADEALYPGWVRLMLPIGISTGLWAVLLWGAGQLA